MLNSRQNTAASLAASYPRPFAHASTSQVTVAMDSAAMSAVRADSSADNALACWRNAGFHASTAARIAGHVSSSVTSVSNSAMAPTYITRTAYSTVRGERDSPRRMRVAPRSKSRDSARVGRRCPDAAVAISTAMISSPFSRLNERG